MEWVNVHVSIVRSPEYIGSEPTERATWFNVLAYSVEQENSGRIVGAADWKDRQWQQTCGVTLREVREATKLLLWDGPDLVVEFYPLKAEEVLKKKRTGGKSGGQRSGEARRKDSLAIGRSTPSTTPSPEGQGDGEGDLERKEKEGKVREEEGKEGGDEGVLRLEPASSEPIGPIFTKATAALDTPEFLKAWEEWLMYRRERRLPTYKPTALAKQLAALAEWGHDAAIASISESIRQQWQGLFQPKGSPKTNGGNPFQMPRSDHTKGF